MPPPLEGDLTDEERQERIEVVLGQIRDYVATMRQLRIQVGLTRRELEALGHPLSQTTGDKIRSLRELFGWSQEELGERVGVHKMTVSLWERNVRKPSDSHARNLALLFGGDVRDFREDGYIDEL